jgi:hypothetical protein
METLFGDHVNQVTQFFFDFIHHNQFFSTFRIIAFMSKGLFSFHSVDGESIDIFIWKFSYIGCNIFSGHLIIEK